MFALWDTFNDKAISRHRTIENVAKAWSKHSRWWKRKGDGSYIPTDIRNEDGSRVSDEDIELFIDRLNHFDPLTR
jgi:hypothetical protein